MYFSTFLRGGKCVRSGAAERRNSEANWKFDGNSAVIGQGVEEANYDIITGRNLNFREKENNLADSPVSRIIFRFLRSRVEEGHQLTGV